MNQQSKEAAYWEAGSCLSAWCYFLSLSFSDVATHRHSQATKPSNPSIIHANIRWLWSLPLLAQPLVLESRSHPHSRCIVDDKINDVSVEPKKNFVLLLLSLPSPEVNYSSNIIGHLGEERVGSDDFFGFDFVSQQQRQPNRSDHARQTFFLHEITKIKSSPLFLKLSGVPENHAAPKGFGSCLV